MKKDLQRIIIIFPALLAAMLAVACAKSPGVNESDPETSRGEHTEAETNEASSGNPGVVVSSVPGSAASKKEIDSKMIAGRVLTKLRNQCLKWYYSDCILLGKSANGNETEIIIRPGDTVYYKILTDGNKTIYQVLFATDEGFANSFSMDYVYYSEMDQIVSTALNQPQENEVLSGSFVLSDVIPPHEEAKMTALRKQFSLFWEKWLAEKANADMVNALKQAYLMPFAIEEDGTAKLCVFLEQESGTWLMASCEADYSYVIPESESDRVANWGDTLFGGYTTMSSGMWDNHSEETLIVKVPDDMKLQFERIYVPYDSGYTLLALNSGVSGKGLLPEFVGFRTVEGEEFLKTVPEMALEKVGK